MKRNIGTMDRTLRIVVGIALISIVFIGPQMPWGWIGLLPLLTGLIGWCPPYHLLGINTCGKSGCCGSAGECKGG